MGVGARIQRGSPRRLEAVVTIAGTFLVLLVVSHYRHTYFFYDEWGMIDRVTSGGDQLKSAFESFNGHLWFFPYLIYLAQVRWFGLVNHGFLFVIFCISLLVLYGALTGVLRALRVPGEIAAPVAAVLTYFGPGSQSMVFEVQLSWNLAMALSLSSAVIVLRGPFTRGRAVAAAGALLIGAGWDGVSAILVAVFIAAVALGSWRRIAALFVLAPTAALLAVWRDAGGGGGPSQPPRSVNAGAHFALTLFLSAVGGLAGQAVVLGAFISGVVAVIVILSVRSGRVSAGSRWACLGGAAATALALISITWTRAGLVGADLRDYNRYIQLIAIFTVLALVPLLVDCARTRDEARDRRRAAIAAAGLVFVFIANLSPLRSYRQTFEGWNMQTRQLVAQAVAVVKGGCPPGTVADASVRPLGSLDPQISVSLLQRLDAQKVSLPEGASGDGRMVSTICVAETRLTGPSH